MLSAINPFAEAYVPREMKSKNAIDIQVGSPSLLVDAWRNLVSIPAKILMWNSSYNSGNVSEETLAQVRDFLHTNGLHDVSVSVNQYKPQEVWSRVFTNPKTSFLSKCTFGVATGFAETILFPRLTGIASDHYSFSANTVHLLSNDPALALYACGAAKDFNEKENPTLYAMLNAVPIVGTVSIVSQSFQAAKNAMQYVKQQSNVEAVQHAWTVLTPIVATVVAGAVASAYMKPALDEVQSALELSLRNGSSNVYVDMALNKFVSDVQTCALGAIGILAAGHLLGRWVAANVQEQRPSKCPIHHAQVKIPA